MDDEATRRRRPVDTTPFQWNLETELRRWQEFTHNGSSGMITITASDFVNSPTLGRGQCCDLKRDEHGCRVWVCRVGGGVTVESLGTDGRWRVTSGGCEAEFAGLATS
jgi:hypothetical protein